MNRRNLLKGLAAVPFLAAPLRRGWAATARTAVDVGELQKNWKALLAQGADVALTPEPLRRTNEEWKQILTPAQYSVLRREGTERAGSSPLNDEKRQGLFVCAGCGEKLFDAATKFESGTGWPSFWQPLAGGIGTTTDRSFFMTRTEVHCAKCGGHLGHVFPDGPAPTGQRYCMNGAAMKFEEKK